MTKFIYNIKDSLLCYNWEISMDYYDMCQTNGCISTWSLRSLLLIWCLLAYLLFLIDIFCRFRYLSFFIWVELINLVRRLFLRNILLLRFLYFLIILSCSFSVFVLFCWISYADLLSFIIISSLTIFTLIFHTNFSVLIVLYIPIKKPEYPIYYTYYSS